mmetsp:Transcript_11371/g.42673  ORF Transcript_11371/g.42673 Transcript_11371/m.42673 type:complete len:268 (+) Transcript_11371:269-1072(+)
MVLNLKVEVRHPPVDSNRWRNVQCVVCCEAHPVSVLVLQKVWHVGMREGEVSENVYHEHSLDEKVCNECTGNGAIIEVSSVQSQKVIHSHEWKLPVIFCANRMTRMQHKSPQEPHQFQKGKVQNVLILKECRVTLLGNLIVEGNKWKSVEIDVVANLLRSGMVLIVLVAPKGGRATTSNSIQNGLQRLVKFDISHQRKVPRLMHEPSISSHCNAQSSTSNNKVTLGTQNEPKYSESHQFEKSPHNVQWGIVKDTLLDKFLSHFSKVA